MSNSGHGERDGDRAAMERVQKRIMGDGIERNEARKMARESMIRVDRQQRERGQR